MHFKMAVKKFAMMVGLYLLFVMFTPVSAVIPQGTRDELIRYYFNQGYTWKEICGFLLFVHNIIVSLSQMKRIVKRLQLRRYNVTSPLVEIIPMVSQIYQRGYCNAGYRTIWHVLNTTTNLNATQETVRLILRILDPEGVILRRHHRLRRRLYRNPGPNHTIHVDGYDKLKPFGIAIHGAMDGFSRRILWLEACYSNNNPKIVGRFYLDFVKQIGRCPRIVRADRGTENVLIKDFQTVLRYYCTDEMAGSKSYICGKSTSNQRIERFWCNLNLSVTLFWRNHFKGLCELGKLNMDDPVHLECVRYCFLPLIQHEMDAFVRVWNSHRIRRQRNPVVPSGIPNVLYDQPFVVGAEDHSYQLPCDIQTIDLIRDQYTIPKPEYGCSDAFVQIVEILCELPREQIPRPSTVELCTALFVGLTELIDTYRA